MDGANPCWPDLQSLKLGSWHDRIGRQSALRRIFEEIVTAELTSPDTRRFHPHRSVSLVVLLRCALINPTPIVRSRPERNHTQHPRLSHALPTVQTLSPIHALVR